jgi:hypothetical protein
LHLNTFTKDIGGSSMSESPGNINIEGVNIIHEEKNFVLKFIKARKQDWTNKTFFAKYNENMKWFTDLKPGFGKSKFFFEDEFDELKLKKETFYGKQSA